MTGSDFSAAEPPAPGRQPAPAGWIWRKLLGGDLGALAALAMIVLLFALLDQRFGGGSFTSVRNLRVQLVQMTDVAIAALGMTMIIIAGGIDLSAGAMLTLCSTVLAVGLKNDWPVALALLLALGTGTLCGLINGALINLLRVVPFIVTLGTMTIFLGLGSILAAESTVAPGLERIPPWLANLCSSKPPDWLLMPLPNLPWGVWLAVLLSVLVALLLKYTVLGRHIFALGSNEATARLCGVAVSGVRLAVYALAGLLTAIAGICFFCQTHTADPEQGRGIELQIIAAVVIGGGSLSGGRGSVLGTLAGAAIMGVINSGCTQLNVPNPYQNILIGLIIVVAVAFDQLRQRRLASA